MGLAFCYVAFQIRFSHHQTIGTNALASWIVPPVDRVLVHIPFPSRRATVRLAATTNKVSSLSSALSPIERTISVFVASSTSFLARFL